MKRRSLCECGSMHLRLSPVSGEILINLSLARILLTQIGCISCLQDLFSMYLNYCSICIVNFYVIAKYFSLWATTLQSFTINHNNNNNNNNNNKITTLFKKKIEWIIHSIYGVKKFHSLRSEFHSILTPVEWKFTTQRVESCPVHSIFTPK